MPYSSPYASRTFESFPQFEWPVHEWVQVQVLGMLQFFLIDGGQGGQKQQFFQFQFVRNQPCHALPKSGELLLFVLELLLRNQDLQ